MITVCRGWLWSVNVSCMCVCVIICESMRACGNQMWTVCALCKVVNCVCEIVNKLWKLDNCAVRACEVSIQCAKLQLRYATIVNVLCQRLFISLTWLTLWWVCVKLVVSPSSLSWIHWYCGYNVWECSVTSDQVVLTLLDFAAAALWMCKECVIWCV